MTFSLTFYKSHCELTLSIEYHLTHRFCYEEITEMLIVTSQAKFVCSTFRHQVNSVRKKGGKSLWQLTCLLKYTLVWLGRHQLNTSYLFGKKNFHWENTTISLAYGQGFWVFSWLMIHVEKHNSTGHPVQCDSKADFPRWCKKSAQASHGKQNYESFHKFYFNSCQ